MNEEIKCYLVELDNNIFNNILFYISNEEEDYFYLYENINDLLNTCKSLKKLKYYFSYFDFFRSFSKKYYLDKKFRDYVTSKINTKKT
jgi:hypothetical protein